MNSNPLVSVIVPVYGVEKYLPKCMDSLIASDYQNIEILVIDDGSPDRCPDICDEYAAKDSRITVLHKKNEGLSAARNDGMEIMKGEFFAFVDSDDYVAPNYISTMLNRLLEDSYDLVITSLEEVNEDGTVQMGSLIFEDHEETGREIWNGFMDERIRHFPSVVVWNKLFKTSLFGDIRFPENRHFEDLWVMPEIMSRCKRIRFCSDAVYFYRHRESSIMHSKYSMVNLDSLSAYLKLSDFFAEQDLPQLCQKALIVCTFKLDEAYANLAGTSIQADETIRQYRKQYMEISSRHKDCIRWDHHGLNVHLMRLGRKPFRAYRSILKTVFRKEI